MVIVQLSGGLGNQMFEYALYLSLKARNAGTGQALGSYIAFVDGDDWIEKEMYEGLLSAARQFDAPLAVCRYRKIYQCQGVNQ